MDTRPAPPSKQQLASLRPGELYWLSVEPIWEVVDIYGAPSRFLETFGMVNEAQGLLVAAHWCQSEVCNGGLHQVFSNSTGVLAPEAIRGFELLQIAEVPRIVAAAVAMFGSMYPRDRETRGQQLGELEKAGDRRSDWDPFYELDEQFYAATGSAAFADAADRFVRTHLSLFFQTIH